MTLFDNYFFAKTQFFSDTNFLIKESLNFEGTKNRRADFTLSKNYV